MDANLIILIAVGGIGFVLLGALIALFFISRRSQRVMDSVLQIMLHPERARVADAARVLQNILNDEITKIDDNFKSIQSTLGAQIADAVALKNELSERNDALVAIADNATKKMANTAGRLENVLGGLTGVVDSSGWRDVLDSTDNFESRINGLLDKVDATSNDILERTATVQNQIDGWIESGKSLSEQLTADAEQNVASMNLIGAESHTVMKKLEELSVAVTANFDIVRERAAEYEKLTANNDNLLAAQIKKLDVFTKQSRTLLNNQMNTLTNAANTVGGQVRLVESSIEKQIRKLTEVVESLMQSATATEGSVRNISMELAGLTGKFNGEIKEFATGVVAELKTVSGVANTTLENTKSAAGAFSESVRAMATGVRETLMEMNTAHKQLSGQSEHLIKMSAETTAQLQPLSELIEKYYTALPDLTVGSVEMGAHLEETLEALTERISVMRETVTESITGISESSRQLETLSGQSRQQMIDLMSDYAKATDTMETLNKQMMVARATAPMDAIKSATSVAPVYAKISSADFIKQSERAFEKMHEQSMDLTRSIGAEIPDAVWKKYNAGDVAIASKWLAKILSAADARQIRDTMKSNAAFRSQAAQFVRAFDKVVAIANQADGADKLVATLMKTDFGQIYKVLKI